MGKFFDFFKGRTKRKEEDKKQKPQAFALRLKNLKARYKCEGCQGKMRVRENGYYFLSRWDEQEETTLDKGIPVIVFECPKCWMIRLHIY